MNFDFACQILDIEIACVAIWALARARPVFLYVHKKSKDKMHGNNSRNRVHHRCGGISCLRGAPSLLKRARRRFHINFWTRCDAWNGPALASHKSQNAVYSALNVESNRLVSELWFLTLLMKMLMLPEDTLLCQSSRGYCSPSKFSRWFEKWFEINWQTFCMRVSVKSTDKPPRQ